MNIANMYQYDGFENKVLYNKTPMSSGLVICSIHKIVMIMIQGLSFLDSIIYFKSPFPHVVSNKALSCSPLMSPTSFIPIPDKDTSMPLCENP